jgi:hypothetical protein
MEPGYETTAFNGQRVIDRITEQPFLASRLLEALREDPFESDDQSNQIEQEYGKEAQDLHTLLGSIIRNRDLYLAIDLDDQVIEAAAQDLAQQQQTNSSQGLTKNNKDELSPDELKRIEEKQALSNRANELLALARIATFNQTNTSQQKIGA